MPTNFLTSTKVVDAAVAIGVSEDHDGAGDRVVAGIDRRHRCPHDDVLLFTQDCLGASDLKGVRDHTCSALGSTVGLESLPGRDRQGSGDPKDRDHDHHLDERKTSNSTLLHRGRLPFSERAVHEAEGPPRIHELLAPTAKSKAHAKLRNRLFPGPS